MSVINSPCRVLVAAALACLLQAAPVAAQVAPIKPGLWEVRMRQEEAGRAQPGIAELLQKMPPGERKQFEEMMRKQGVDVSGGSSMKVCYTREVLDSDRWADFARDTCRTEFQSRTAARWAWRATCNQPEPVVAEGEAVFPSPETYRMKVVSRRTGASGKAGEQRIDIDARWLAADCGNVKPVAPPKSR